MDPIGLVRWVVPVALSILPGAACVLWAWPATAGRPARWGAMLALSTPLGAGVIALLLLAGCPPAAAAHLLLTASVLAVAAALVVRRVRDRRPAPGAATAAPWSGADRAALVFTVLACALVSLFPIVWEWWRISSDVWTHAAIVRSISDFGVPPLDPGYAGLRLQYPWVYHAMVAALGEASGLDLYSLMSFLETMALAGLLLSVSGLVRAEGRGRMLMALSLLTFGLNALFPLFLPIAFGRALFGEVRGLPEIARQLDLFPLEWQSTGVFLRSAGGQDFFLNKFMVVTPFSLGLAAFAAALGAVKRCVDGGGGGELVLAALSILGAGLMHPVIGVHLVATLAMTIPAALLLSRADLAPARLVGLGLAVIAAAIPFGSFFASIAGGAGGSHRSLPFDLAPLKLLGYASCLALGLLLAARPLRRGWRDGGAARFWTLWILAGLTLAVVFRLPGPTPFFTVDKFSYLLWIPLAPLAGIELHRVLAARPVAMRAIVLLLLFLPVNGLALLSRAVDPHTAGRQPWNEAGYVWARANLPRDAVLVTPLGDWDTGGFVERDQYYTLDHAALQLGYPFEEIRARRKILLRVFAGEPLAGEDRRRLEALGRPVYALWTDFTDPRWAWTPGEGARGKETFVPAPPGPALYADERIRIV